MTEEFIQHLRATLAYHAKLFGADGDCGASCAFIKINDLRALCKAAGITTEQEQA